MIRRIIGVLIAFLLWSSAGFAAITVRNEHPRMFINSDNIAGLQARVKPVANGGLETHTATYNTLKAWCDARWNSPASQVYSPTILDSRDWDNGLLRYALIYALGSIPGISYAHTINEYGDQAKAQMLYIMNLYPAGSTLPDIGQKFLAPLAITYDWIYPRLSDSDKATMVQWFYLTVYTRDMAASGYSPAFYDPTHHGYRFLNTPFSLYPGLAFYGDGVSGSYGGQTADQVAASYVNFIENSYLPDARAMSHMSSDDGGSLAGFAYGQYTYAGAYRLAHLGKDFWLLTTATNLTKDETYNLYPYPRGYPMWTLYGIRPGDPSGDSTGRTELFTFPKWDDCGNWLWNYYSEDVTLADTFRVAVAMANANGDSTTAGVLTWLINTKMGWPLINSTWDIIFNDRTTAAVDPGTAGIALNKAFGWDTATGAIDQAYGNSKAGVGEVFMRSSWDFDYSTTHAAFRAFPYYYFGHQHFDSLTFDIYKGEPLVISNAGRYYMHYEGGVLDGAGSGFPHHWNYYKRGLASNTLLVMDPAEAVKDPTSGIQYSDGGQRTGLDGSTYWGQAVPGSSRDWGGLIAHEDSTDYTYSAGDATKGYNSTVDGADYLSHVGASPKTTLVQREFIYLKGTNEFFVVFDRIDAITAAHKRVFLLHTTPEPELNGSSTQVYGTTASAGLFSSTNSTGFEATGTYGKLLGATLLPSTRTIYKSGGRATTTLATTITAADGAAIGGPTLNIDVANAAAFPDKPVVIINPYSASGGEAMMCTGKDGNTLTGCYRGDRYWRATHNTAVEHLAGEVVEQGYDCLTQRASDNSWINWPQHYGDAYSEPGHLKASDEYGKWTLRIEDSTSPATTHTNFLNVLHPTTNLLATMPTTTLITSTGGSPAYGALIADSTPRIVIFSPTTQKLSDVSYDAGYSGAGKHLVVNLYPSVGYWIYKAGIRVSKVTSSDQGTISFTSTGGGSFRVTRYIVNDFTFYSTPSVSRPAKGTPIEDFDFLTTVTRMTDSPVDFHGTTYNYAQPGYVKHPIDNADGTYLIVQSFKSPCWHIVDALTLTKFKDLPTISGYDSCDGSNNPTDARWDSQESAILYFYQGPKFYRWNINDVSPTVVHDFTGDFPGYTIRKISFQEEGGPSDSGRYWAFLAWSVGSSTQTHLLVYDKTGDTIIASKTFGEGNGNCVTGLPHSYPSDFVWAYNSGTCASLEFNWVKMSPSGNYVVTGSPPGWIYNRDLTSTRAVSMGSHADTAYDDEANEVFVDASTYYNPGDLGTWTRMTNLSTGTVQWLSPFPGGNDHIDSSYHGQGWAVISKYAPDDCYAMRTIWNDGSVHIIELSSRIASPDFSNHARVWRIANSHTCKMSSSDYSNDQFAKFARDGKSVYFGSSWQSPEFKAGGQYDIYKVSLPTNWESDMLGLPPPPPPVAPILSTPANGATGVSITPTFTWGSSPNATSYTLQISTTSGFTSHTDYTTAGTSYPVTSPLVNNTVYYWRVYATGAGGSSPNSATRDFTTVQAGIPAQVTLKSPASGTTGYSLLGVLEWYPVADADTYKLQVSVSSSFSSTAINATGISDTTYSLDGSGLAEATTYYWRVRGTGTGGDGSWSSVWNFRTLGTGSPPSPPVVTRPINGATGVSNTVQFSMYTVSGVTYQIQVDTVNDFSTSPLPVDISCCSYCGTCMRAALSDGWYYWRARGVNDAGPSAWTPTWSFCVGTNCSQTMPGAGQIKPASGPRLKAGSGPKMKLQ